MISLNQNSSNTIALTLSENITGVTNFYMTLKSDMSNYEISGITLTDTSLYTDRYNLFELTITGLSSAQDLTGSTVYLSDTGYYQYKCYNNTTLIETGKMLLIGDDIITQSTYTTNDEPTFHIYQNK